MNCRLEVHHHVSAKPKGQTTQLVARARMRQESFPRWQHMPEGAPAYPEEIFRAGFLRHLVAQAVVCRIASIRFSILLSSKNGKPNTYNIMKATICILVWPGSNLYG